MMIAKRQSVEALEDALQHMAQVFCPVRHYFAGGIYAREMTIPAGVVLTGAVHRHEHLCTISQGRIRVTTDDGLCEIAAPYTLISKPGAKRAGYALETTVWTTYHKTDETDLDRVMREITESENSELLGGRDNVQARNNQIARDHADYAKFLEEFGLTQEEVQQYLDYTDDAHALPFGADWFRIGPSPVHGLGVFAARDFGMQESLGFARVMDGRTILGRYINHSCQPNAIFALNADGNLLVWPIKPILAGGEITIDYRSSMSVNGAGFAPIERITT